MGRPKLSKEEKEKRLALKTTKKNRIHRFKKLSRLMAEEAIGAIFSCPKCEHMVISSHKSL